MRTATIADFTGPRLFQPVSRPAMNTRFILIQTSHAGNVGAAARAMKVMGFDDLVLVAPRWDDVLQREETIQRASGAIDVLERARIVDTLDEALDGVTHLCATAMTPRDFGPPTFTPREHLAALAAGGAARGLPVRLGTLRHEQRGRLPLPCGAQHPDRSGLRLAEPGGGDPGDCVRMAHWRWAASACAPRDRAGTGRPTPRPWPACWRTGSRRWSRSASWTRQAPKKLMPRLNQLFNRAQPTPEEIHILRGVAKAMSEAAAGENIDGAR